MDILSGPGVSRDHHLLDPLSSNDKFISNGLDYAILDTGCERKRYGDASLIMARG